MALFSSPLSEEQERRAAKRAVRREPGANARDRGRLLVSAVSLVAFFAVWALAAWIAQSRHLPDPVAVAQRIVAETASGQLLFHVGVTLARVVASFVLAVVIGSAIGFAMGRSSRLNLFFDSWLILFLNLPALIVIILCFLWFGLNEAAAITAVALNKIPNVAVIIREGTQALSPAYDDLATVYRFGWWTRLREVHLPQLAPYFAAAGRSGLAIVWKIVLVVELLGLSSGVGFQLNTFFQLFDVTGILAYAASFIAVIFLIETFVMRPWQLAANRWRQ
jgi:NitT/TauT family transport system permease protein